MSPGPVTWFARSDLVKVFIQNEAGSNQKNYHDEKTLEWKRVTMVSSPYPFPYGFIVGTTGEDDCNVDCFIITSKPLVTGQLVDCDAIGLMEQIEDGDQDHNILARLPGTDLQVTPEIERTLTDFVMHVFDHVDCKQIRVGRFLGSEAADTYVAAHRNEPEETGSK